MNCGSFIEESKTGLSQEGIINDGAISIRVECPPQDCIYEAWQDPCGSCHQLFWWPVSNQIERANASKYGFHDFKAFEVLSPIFPCHCTQYKQEILDSFQGKASECGAGLVIKL